MLLQRLKKEHRGLIDDLIAGVATAAWQSRTAVN